MARARIAAGGRGGCVARAGIGGVARDSARPPRTVRWRDGGARLCAKRSSRRLSRCRGAAWRRRTKRGIGVKEPLPASDGDGVLLLFLVVVALRRVQ
eukprot:2542868-Prymnesium_polylepis.1